MAVVMMTEGVVVDMEAEEEVVGDIAVAEDMVVVVVVSRAFVFAFVYLLASVCWGFPGNQVPVQCYCLFGQGGIIHASQGNKFGSIATLWYSMHLKMISHNGSLLELCLVERQ